MTPDEALDIFECIENLTPEELIRYTCHHVYELKSAAAIGADAVRRCQRLDKLLECWEVSDDG